MRSLISGRFGCVAGLSALLMVSVAALADGPQSRGQILYVPVYSEVPYGDKGITINLTATLSLRNTDAKRPIVIKRVDYFSSAGTLVRSYVTQPVKLSPMASVEHIVKESDRSGGISASFVIEWDSEVPVVVPIAEAIMVSSTYNRAVAFSASARVLSEKP